MLAVQNEKKELLSLFVKLETDKATLEEKVRYLEKEKIDITSLKLEAKEMAKKMLLTEFDVLDRLYVRKQREAENRHAIELEKTLQGNLQLKIEIKQLKEQVETLSKNLKHDAVERSWCKESSPECSSSWGEEQKIVNPRRDKNTKTLTSWGKKQKQKIVNATCKKNTDVITSKVEEKTSVKIQCEKNIQERNSCNQLPKSESWDEYQPSSLPSGSPQSDFLNHIIQHGPKRYNGPNNHRTNPFWLKFRHPEWKEALEALESKTVTPTSTPESTPETQVAV